MALYDKGSLIITRQVPVDRWHELIGIPTLADAVQSSGRRQSLRERVSASPKPWSGPYAGCRASTSRLPDGQAELFIPSGYAAFVEMSSNVPFDTSSLRWASIRGADSDRHFFVRSAMSSPSAVAMRPSTMMLGLRFPSSTPLR